MPRHLSGEKTGGGVDPWMDAWFRDCIASQDLSCRPGYLDGSLYASNATPASASAWCVQTVSLDDRRITGAVNKTKHASYLYYFKLNNAC